MPPRRPPPSSAASVGALLNRAQDTGSAAAHAKLAPHLWAHLGKLGEDAFWGELVGAVDYLLTIAPVSFFLCGGERGTGRGGAGIDGANWTRRRASAHAAREGPRGRGPHGRAVGVSACRHADKSADWMLVACESTSLSRAAPGGEAPRAEKGSDRQKKPAR